MTEENYNYRTSQALLRNQFPGRGKLQIPIIPKFQVKEDDFNDLLLIGFDKTRPEDQNHLNRMVHFFLYDYKFERVWKNPDTDIEKLSRYRAVLSPDFSMYLEMAPVIQLYNVFRNRWCGAYWASKGVRVVPTVNWGDASTFDFCFEGIEKGSVVAVSTYMASEHDHRKDQKEWFLAGYNEMLRRIEPEKIICYNTPFPEMQGDIVYVDFERSSWRYMDYEQKAVSNNNLDCYKIGGPKQNICDTIDVYMIGKGGGSAFGGKWRPSPKKPEDQRFLGKPGEIKTTHKNGYRVETKIGENGRATVERHYTDHKQPWAHSNPHDHPIHWNNPAEFPDPQPPINYPDGAPEFKQFRGDYMKNTIVPANTYEQNQFVTISDFKTCMRWHGEVEFTWNGTTYNITHRQNKIAISVSFRQETEKLCNTADEVLDYMVGEDRLRDVITKVTVTDRTI